MIIIILIYYINWMSENMTEREGERERRYKYNTIN